MRRRENWRWGEGEEKGKKKETDRHRDKDSRLTKFTYSIYDTSYWILYLNTIPNAVWLRR